MGKGDSALPLSDAHTIKAVPNFHHQVGHQCGIEDINDNHRGVLVTLADDCVVDMDELRPNLEVAVKGRVPTVGRRGRDSNPRYPCGYSGLANRRTRPTMRPLRDACAGNVAHPEYTEGV